MIFKEKNNKKVKKKKHWFFYLISGVLFFKLFKFLRKSSDLKDEIIDIEHNFLDFLHKEKKEVVKLENHQENLQKFYHDSSHIFLDYFIPYDGNNHKPKILHPHSLIVIAAAVFFLKLALVGYLFFVNPSDGRMSEDIISAVIAKVNQDRTIAGLPELKINNVLSASAKIKAQDMLDKDYFAHYSPDGKKPWDFISRDQYEYLYVGENLAINFTSADSVHQALMNSPSHKKNILSDRYQDFGIAMLSGELNGKETNVLVQLFGTEKELSPAKDFALNINTDAIQKELKDGDTIVVAGFGKTIAITKEDEKPIINDSPAKEIPVKIKDSEPVEIEVQKEAVSQVSNPAPKISREIVSSPTMLSSKKSMDLVSPNSELEDKTVNNLEGFENNIDKKAILGSGVAKSVNIVLVGVLVLLNAFLFINIIVRIEVQHKPVILQTLLLMLFISSLIIFKVHNLEGGLSDILIL